MFLKIALFRFVTGSSLIMAVHKHKSFTTLASISCNAAFCVALSQVTTSGEKWYIDFLEGTIR